MEVSYSTAAIAGCEFPWLPHDRHRAVPTRSTHREGQYRRPASITAVLSASGIVHALVLPARQSPGTGRGRAPGSHPIPPSRLRRRRPRQASIPDISWVTAPPRPGVGRPAVIVTESASRSDPPPGAVSAACLNTNRCTRCGHRPARRIAGGVGRLEANDGVPSRLTVAAAPGSAPTRRRRRRRRLVQHSGDARLRVGRPAAIVTGPLRQPADPPEGDNAEPSCRCTPRRRRPAEGYPRRRPPGTQPTCSPTPRPSAVPHSNRTTPRPAVDVVAMLVVREARAPRSVDPTPSASPGCSPPGRRAGHGRHRRCDRSVSHAAVQHRLACRVGDCHLEGVSPDVNAGTSEPALAALDGVPVERHPVVFATMVDCPRDLRPSAAETAAGRVVNFRLGAAARGCMT